MKLAIFLVCSTLFCLVSPKPQVSNEQQLNSILSNPQFGTFLQQLSQQFLQLQSTSSTTELPSPSTQRHIKNPFFTSATKSSEDVELQTSAPLVDLEKNHFFNKIVPKVTSRPSPFPKNVFLNSAPVETSTKSSEVFENNVFLNKKALSTRSPVHVVRATKHNLDAGDVLKEARKSEEDEKVFKHQAESAQYAFASEINDSINDNSNYREEVRDGLSVKGKYSYSDGFYKRTVVYEADDKGYRVVGEKVEAIGEGPQSNPEGVADVATYVAGSTLKYHITSDDIVKTNQTTSTLEEI